MWRRAARSVGCGLSTGIAGGRGEGRGRRSARGRAKQRAPCAASAAAGRQEHHATTSPRRYATTSIPKVCNHVNLGECAHPYSFFRLYAPRSVAPPLGGAPRLEPRTSFRRELRGGAVQRPLRQRAGRGAQTQQGFPKYFAGFPKLCLILRTHIAFGRAHIALD